MRVRWTLLVLMLALLLSVAGRPGATSATTGITPVQLNPDLPATSDVFAFKISPDGHYAVYISNISLADASELYSVPTDGSAAPQRLTPLPTSGYSIEQFWISPDSQYVVYIANQDTLERRELYSVPIGGGPSVKLSPPVDSFESYLITTLTFDPQNMVVFYAFAAVADNVAVRAIYRATLSSGAPTLISDPSLLATAPALSADGSTLFYLAYNDNHNNYLYRVSRSGGTSYQLNPNLDYNQYISEFVLAPDQQALTYKRITQHPSQNNVYRQELFQIDLNGNAPLRLSFDAPNYYASDDLRYTADSRYVVYTSDQRITDTLELFRADTQTGDVVRLSPLLPATGNIYYYQLSPDEHWVLYRLSVQGAQRQLYAVSLDGQSAVMLSGLPRPDIFMPESAIISDSSAAVFVADYEVAYRYGLYTQPFTATGAPTRLFPTLGESDVENLLPVPGQRGLTFQATSNDNSFSRLYYADLNTNAVTELTPDFIATGDIYQENVIFRRDGRWYAAFVADYAVDNQYNLYTVALPLAAPTSFQLYLPALLR